jgi:hypothetical protein
VGTVRSHMRTRACALAFATASACGRAASHAHEAASLYLTCMPALHGVHCRLLALPYDVSRSPRDITAAVSWHLEGMAAARISKDGWVDAPADGVVELSALFDGHRVALRVRLARDRPGQVLATLRGRVYAETQRGLRPIAGAHVEVIGGPSAGLSTTTLSDGSYEFAGVVPDEIGIRAGKIGYASGESSTQLHAGDNRLNALIVLLPPAASLRLSTNRAYHLADVRDCATSRATRLRAPPA